MVWHMLDVGGSNGTYDKPPIDFPALIRSRRRQREVRRGGDEEMRIEPLAPHVPVVGLLNANFDALR